MNSQIIIALDCPDYKSAVSMVEAIGDSGHYYKVGLELFVADGSKIIPWLKEKGKKIFLDLKIHDIPNTASKAVLSCLKHQIDMVNLHIQGGPEMMKLCAETVQKHSPSTLLIGVTLLTSLDNNYLNRYKIGFEDAEDYVLFLAGVAKENGLNGVVCSAKEVVDIKNTFGADFVTVTPGIRVLSGKLNDQKRVVTPQRAALLGTDYMVIGRSITESKDPAKTLNDILLSIKTSK